MLSVGIGSAEADNNSCMIIFSLLHLLLHWWKAVSVGSFCLLFLVSIAKDNIGNRCQATHRFQLHWSETIHWNQIQGNFPQIRRYVSELVIRFGGVGVWVVKRILRCLPLTGSRWIATEWIKSLTMSHLRDESMIETRFALPSLRAFRFNYIPSRTQSHWVGTLLNESKLCLPATTLMGELKSARHN